MSFRPVQMMLTYWVKENTETQIDANKYINIEKMYVYTLYL